jgi:hypothetical protein
MPDELVGKMINAASEKNAVDFKSSLEDSMNERIATQLRDRKMERFQRSTDGNSFQEEKRSSDGPKRHCYEGNFTG